MSPGPHCIQGPLGAWVEEGRLQRDQCEWNSARSLTVFSSLCSMGNQRWQTKFDWGLWCPHYARQALHCWLSLRGRSVLGRDPFVVLYCSLPWVRASRPLSWLCYWFGIVENIPESLEVQPTVLSFFLVPFHHTHSLLLVVVSEGRVRVHCPISW